MSKPKYEEVRFGYQLPLYPWNMILDFTKYCEEVGFDAAVMADHTVAFGIKRFDSLEAWTVLAALATQTKRVMLGTVVSDVHRHHPAVLAQMVTTVDIISGGRAFLGIGVGEAMNLDPYGIPWDKRVTRTYEGVRAIKMLWTSDERITWQGKIFKLEKALLQPKPVQKPHPPLIIAANSPQTLRIAAELGDGWIPFFLTPEEYSQRLAELREMARSNFGRDPDSITPAYYTYCVVSKNPEEAKKAIEIPAKMYLIQAPELLKKFGVEVSDEYKITKIVFNEETVKKMLEEAKKVPDEALEGRFICGSPGDCIEQIDAYIKAGVKFFSIPLLVRYEQMKDTLELFAKEVIAYFRGLA